MNKSFVQNTCFFLIFFIELMELYVQKLIHFYYVYLSQFFFFIFDFLKSFLNYSSFVNFVIFELKLWMENLSMGTVLCQETTFSVVYYHNLEFFYQKKRIHGTMYDLNYFHNNFCKENNQYNSNKNIF